MSYVKTYLLHEEVSVHSEAGWKVYRLTLFFVTIEVAVQLPVKIERKLPLFAPGTAPPV